MKKTDWEEWYEVGYAYAFKVIKKWLKEHKYPTSHELYKLVEKELAGVSDE